MPLDPHLVRMLRAVSAGGGGDGAAATVTQRRAAFRELMAFAETGARVAAIVDDVLPGPAGPLRVRIYTPRGIAGDRLPGVVFCHGGGLIAGDLDTHDPLCRALCHETGCRLIAVDYRLAPEHRFPAAVEDAHAATLWVSRHADRLGLDPGRLAIAGDSAGGTLAAAVCQRAAAAGEPFLALQVLLCPILDWVQESPSRRAFDGYLVGRDTLRQELAWYLPPGEDAAHPWVSPLRAADLGGLPPTHIHTAECDPLRDEGRAYAERLAASGVAVRHTCHPGMVHLFYGLGAIVPYARGALRQVGAEVRSALSAQPAGAAPGPRAAWA
jgi:acetyl esterase